MRRPTRPLSSFTAIFATTAVILFVALSVPAQAVDRPKARMTPGKGAAPNAEQRTARYFESIRSSPPQMLAFLLKLPKGGDLHSHLSGAVYAESYIQWAANKGLCVNQTSLTLSNPPCDAGEGQPPVSAAFSNSVLYRQLVDSWSMRFWQFSGQNGHDHFFDAFGRFGPAIPGMTGAMLAEVSSRAAKGHVSYLELMLTPDGGMSSQIGQQVGWDGNFERALGNLKTAGIDAAAAAGIKALREADAEKDRLLGCGTPQAGPGCSVTIRYVAQVSRGAALGQVFAQMVTGLALANDPSSRVVGLNLVAPEDSSSAMQNFTVQMEMLNFLQPRYPGAHITLHAGELAPGLVPPEGLTFHIRQSVMKGHAERIGHGVSIMHEDNPEDLLKEMARRNVMVEICLTSNDVILGVSKEQHPLAIYLKYGVPVALATDDEGVARSEISREYLKGVQDQGLGYVQLKTMARTSLQYAFLPGKSLWTDAKKFIPATECADLGGQRALSAACKRYLEDSPKARLQWELEGQLRDFERRY